MTEGNNETINNPEEGKEKKKEQRTKREQIIKVEDSNPNISINYITVNKLKFQLKDRLTD